jgi:hypothetical protein
VSCRDRHGKGTRSPVAGPHLPALHARNVLFEATIVSTVSHLRALWPHELSDLRIHIALGPHKTVHDTVKRWYVDHTNRNITFYRIPLQRLNNTRHWHGEFHQRLILESCIFLAVGELLGKDPWELGPGPSFG